MSWWQILFLNFIFALPAKSAELDTCYYQTRVVVLRNRTVIWRKAISSLASCAVLCSQDGNCKGVVFHHEKNMCLAHGYSYPKRGLSSKSSKVSRFYSSGRDDGYMAAPRFGMYYKLYRRKKTWGGARGVCQGEGGDLITLDSEKKHLYIKRKMKAVHKGEFYVWTALRRKKKTRRNKKSYRWPSGKQYTLRWNNGDPNFGKEHCCYIVAMGFADAECTFKHAYICERKMANM